MFLKNTAANLMTDSHKYCQVTPILIFLAQFFFITILTILQYNTYNSNRTDDTNNTIYYLQDLHRTFTFTLLKHYLQ